MSPVRMRVREPDEICAQAADLARAAATEVVGTGNVGDHVGMEAEADRVVTHLFQCLDPAYHGWRCAVTLTRAARTKTATVSESVLLPGPDAVLAPDWVPWRERLRPGDLGVGDILPAPPDDERLVPALALEGEEGVAAFGEAAASVVAPAPPSEGAGTEPALIPPQARILSAIGRDDAAIRWYASEHGPETPLAHAAPGSCQSCGFFVRLGGPLGRVFGVCANSYAPDDGRVVSVDHGCGGHSEVPLSPGTEPTAPVIDELGYDLADVPGVSVDETDFEPFARS